MIKNLLYISTIDEHAADLAEQYGLGIELCQFCTAYNMDEHYADVQQDVRNCLKKSSRFTMHAPFAELSPASIDPLVLEIVNKRFRQAASLACELNVKHMVVHSGYIPNVYFKEWFIQRSILFWKDLLLELPNDFELFLENVMDDEPQTLKAIADGVNDPRFRLCLDVGHLNILSKISAEEWIHAYGTSLGHVHLHNNHTDWDTHSSLFEGTLDIRSIIEQSLASSPQVTFTLELMDAAPSLKWMKEKELI